MGDEDDDANGDVVLDERTARQLVVAIRETAQTNRVLAQLEERLAAAREEVSKLRRVLFEGNGHSILVRLAKLEGDLSGRTEATVADRRGRWDVRVALIGMLAALATSVVALLK